MRRPLLALLVALAPLAAGCLAGEEPPPADGDATPTPEDDGDGASTPTPSTPPTSGSGDGATSGSGDAGERWYAYQFDAPATPRGGSPGLVRAFSFTTTREENARATIVDVAADVLPASVEQVRSQRVDLTSGSFEPTIVTFPVETFQVRHVLTVQRDDTGEHAEGETAIVTVSIPTEAAPPGMGAIGEFAKIVVERDGVASTLESFVPDTERAADPNAMYLPFTEGEDAASWWGLDLFLATYGLSFFSAWATGEQEFEEGRFDYGGVYYDVAKATFEVGGYSFDGYRLSWGVASPDGSGGYRLEVSPDLPIPISSRFATDAVDASSVYGFELTDVEIR